MTFFLHWIDIGTTEAEWLTASTWNASYAVSDEEVLNVKIDHEEGQVPSMTIQVRNPRVGLLNPTRSIWAWFSWDGPGYAEPLFFGRLVAIPTDLLGEAVTLQFTARSKNYKIDKQIAAEALKVRPYYDPVFIDLMKRDDPDSILEGYSALWHVDRVTLKTTPSDILIGEDGTSIFLDSEVPYDSVSVNLNQTPLLAVAVTASVGWTQNYKGYIDTGTGVIKTYSGDGIIGDWPRPASSLGSGWTVVAGMAKDLNRIATVQNIQYSNTWQNNEKNHKTGDTLSYSVSRDYPNFTASTAYIYREITRNEQLGFMDPHTVDGYGNPSPTNIPASLSTTGTYVPLWRIKYNLGLRYDADRARTERIEFILKSDVQPIMADATTAEETDNISLTGADVGQPIINFKNWTTVAGQYVELGTFVFPDDPLVAGQRSIQVCVVSGIAGTTVPTFSNVAGVTTQDGSVTWSSLGYAAAIYNISADWQKYTLVPLGEIILPREPFSLLYKDYVMPGQMQDPEIGVTADVGLVVEVPNKGFYQCTLSGTTSVNGPDWKTNGSVTKDGTVEWTFIGTRLPSGSDYYICTRSGTTGDSLPRFGDGGQIINDNDVVWTKLAVSEIPIGGSPGMIGRNDYFPTDRGNWSIEYLMCLARARLRLRSRAVEIGFECRFERATKLSCRMNATLYDSRLPGGVATGKIIGYSLIADGDQKTLVGRVRIGCSTGYDGSVSVIAGDPSYVEATYVDPSYQVYSGNVAPIVNDMGYTPPASNFTDPYIFPLTTDRAFLNGGFVKRGSLKKQEDGINSALQTAWYVANYTPVNINNPQEAVYAQKLAMQAAENSVEVNLQKNPIWLELELLPVAGLSYDNFYSIETTALKLPKLIDLEATSTATPPSAGHATLYADVAFRGVGGQVTRTNVPAGHAGAVLNGSGVIGAKTIQIAKGFARFAGASSVLFKGNSVSDTGMLFAGSGAMARPIGRLIRKSGKTFPGNGTIIARGTIRNMFDPVTFAGSGSATALGRLRVPVSLSNSGSGDLAVSTKLLLRSGALLAASGQMSNRQIFASAKFTSEGELPTYFKQGIVGLAGEASVAASGDFQTGDFYGSAAFPGNSVLGTNADLLIPYARYWRVKITDTQTPTAASLANLELYSSAYGANIASGGTAIYSSGSGSAANAFDTDPTTYWTSAGAPTSGTPEYIGYDFGAGNAKQIKAIGIISRTGSPALAPKTFTVDYSNDGSSWTTSWTVSSEPNWSDPEFRLYINPTVPVSYTGSPYGAHTYWRLFTLSCPSGYPCIAELAMRATPGGSNQCSGGTASADAVYAGAYPASYAFDGNVNTIWSGIGATGWLQYAFASPVSVAQIYLTSRNDGYSGTTPNSFVIQFADSASGPWRTTIQTVATGWTVGESRTFTDPRYV